MDEVVDGFAHENAGREIWSEEIVSIRRGTIAGSDMIGLGGIIKALEGPAGRITAGAVLVIGEHLFGRFHRQMWIARQVVIRQKIVPQPRWIVISKPVAPVIAMPPILGLAGDGLE